MSIVGQPQQRRRRAVGAHFVAVLLQAEVRLDDALVRRHGLEAALGDLDAVVERDDAVGDALDDVHVVLDHEDRVAGLLAQPRDQLGDLVRLDRVHPGGGLVEQEHPRLRRGGAGDLEPAPVRVREAVRRLVPAVAHQPLAEEAEPLLGERLDLALLAPHAGRAQDRAHDARLRVRVRGGHHVLLDRHVQEQPQRLERPRDPALRDLVRLEAEQALAGEADVARVRRVHAGHQVEERRLAGAVRADHAEDLVLVDVQVELVDAREPAEAHRDALQLEQALGHQAISTRRAPTSPCGRTFMSTIRITPIRISLVMLGSAARRVFQTNAPR